MDDSYMPRNISHDVEAVGEEAVMTNDDSLPDMNRQGPHDLPRDGDMPTVINRDEAGEDIRGGEMVMHHWKPQAEQHLAGGQLTFALALIVHESGEISQDIPASFQPSKLTSREPVVTTKEVSRGKLIIPSPGWED